jgi:peptidoglycan/xylan/chitin deacetylase (PgdA/CDA1 family)
MVKEINKTNESILNTIGKKPRFFRPPFGITNSFLARAVEKTNMISIGWSLRSLDTVKKQERVLKRIKRKIRPGNIILLHDTSEKTVNVVRELISCLKTNDYKIVSLDKLLGLDAYEAD